MRIPGWIGLGVLSLATVAAGWAQSTSAISQKGRVFTPGEITIQQGATLAIANDDQVLHHVYIEAPGYNFDSGEQPPGKTISITPAKRGTFDVMCAIHPKMRLKVTVN